MNPRRALLLAVALYLAWMLMTYLLEGRVHLLQQRNLLARAIYTVVVNIVIGTALAGLIVRSSLRSGLSTAQQVGFRRLSRALPSAAAASALGFGVFLLLRPGSLEQIVLLNVFAQSLPTSIAEVMVCWAVAGTTIESVTLPRGRWLALLAAISGAAVLFGVYHFAHSPPFNQVGVVAFLTLIGIGTSLVYFFGRDVYATIIVHNYLAMVGIVNNINPAAFRQPLYLLYVLALTSITVLVAVHLLLGRTSPVPVNITLSNIADGAADPSHDPLSFPRVPPP